MKRHLWLITLVLAAGCNSGIYLRDGVTDGDTFYLAPVAMADSDPALQSWVAYSLMRSVCQLEAPGDNPARYSSYDCELRARIALVDAWAEHRVENPAISDDYLDQLHAVQQAGYLGAYTAYFLRRKNWQLPDEVDADAFRTWRRLHLRRHRPQTRIIGYWDYKHRTGMGLPLTD